MDNKDMTFYEKLKELSEVDTREVDPSTLVDIEKVKIRKDLPVDERLKDYIRQIKNPYCYLSHGVVVKISFAGKREMEDCLAACIRMEA